MSRLFPHEITVVRCIMNVTNCTYSLVLGTPVTVPMVDMKGYTLCYVTLVCIVLIVKQFTVYLKPLCF